MHVCLPANVRLPVTHYGGTERVIYWLAKALSELGHRVTVIAPAGSDLPFARVLPLDPQQSLEAQIPRDVDIVHFAGTETVLQNTPSCTTIHGNKSSPSVSPANSIFVSRNHAERHGGTAFVHNGIDPAAYGITPGQLDPVVRRAYVFLAKAAWRVKNVRGAIRIARRAGSPIEILGGRRFNLHMGLRITLDPNARFHGMVDDAQKIPHLRQSRGLIFPVRWHEPFGIAVIEAMLFGAPVFATPYGSLPELVPEFAGALSSSEEALAEAARRWSDYDPRAIHAWCVERFSATAMARKYLMYYEKILSGESLHPGPVRSANTGLDDPLPYTMCA